MPVTIDEFMDAAAPEAPAGKGPMTIDDFMAEDFDPEGSGYDYENAIASGDKPGDDGHWGSVEPRTGLMLKGRKHETWDKAVTAEEARGNQIIQKEDGRYYSVPRTAFGQFFPIERTERPGAWGINQQLDGLFTGRLNLNDLAPFDITHEYGRVVGMADAKNLEDRIKGSILYSVAFDMDPKIAFDNIDSLNKHIFGKELSPTAAWRNNQELLRDTRTWAETIDYARKRAGAGMVKGMAGMGKMLGEYISQEKGPRHIENTVDEWLEKQGIKLAEWSDMMLAAVDDFYKNNTDRVLEVTPGLGYRETLRQYITDPKKLVKGIIESGPLILEGAFGTVLGGPAGGIAVMAGPITGQVYSDARAEGTAPLPAMGQAILTGVGEAAIEEWTLGKKLGIAKNFRKIVAQGLPKVLWEGTKAFFRGTAEEGSQEFNQNFWRWVFTDRSQIWSENVKEASAAGGPMELVMAGAFGAAGMAVGPSVSIEQQNERLDTIQEIVEQVPDEKARREMTAEIEQAREDVAKGIHITWDDVSEERKQQLARIGSQTYKSMGMKQEEAVEELDEQAVRHLREIAAEGDAARRRIENEELRIEKKTAETAEAAVEEGKIEGRKEVQPAEAKGEIRDTNTEKLKALQSQIEEREAGATDEQLSGITKKRRRSLIKETAKKIQGHDIYQTESAAIEEKGLKVGTRVYFIEPSGKGEYEAVLENFPPNIQRKIKKQFTFERSEVKSGRATAWDTAVQERLGSELEEQATMDLSEFIQTVADSIAESAEKGALNTAALERFAQSGYPEAEMLAEKYRMLQRGFSDIEINNMITDWAERNDVPVEIIADELINPEKFETLLNMPEEAREAEIERIATEQILIEDQIAAQNAARQILEANDIKDVEIEPVEEIREEDYQQRRKSFVERDIFGRETVAPMAGKQADLGIGKGTKGKSQYKPELVNAITGAFNTIPIGETTPSNPAEMLKYLKEQAGWEDLFNNYVKPQAEIEGAWDEAVSGREFSFYRGGKKIYGAAFTAGEKQIIHLALGADIETGFHEGWHILRTRLTDNDIATLMVHYGPGRVGEEAEAAAFARYAKGQAAPNSTIRRIFEKIMQIIEKIRSALAGKGLRTPADIFGEAVKGRIEKSEAISAVSVRYELQPRKIKLNWRQNNLKKYLGTVDFLKGEEDGFLYSDGTFSNLDKGERLTHSGVAEEAGVNLEDFMEDGGIRVANAGNYLNLEIWHTPTYFQEKAIEKQLIENAPVHKIYVDSIERIAKRGQFINKYDEVIVEPGREDKAARDVRVLIARRDNVRFETRPVGPVFYSKLQRAVVDKMPNKMDAEAFGNWSKKQGIKDEEMLWLGVDELIAKGGQVTKQQVLDTIAANDIQIEEVVKGGKAEKGIRDLHLVNEDLRILDREQERQTTLLFNEIDDLPQNKKDDIKDFIAGLVGLSGPQVLRRAARYSFGGPMIKQAESNTIRIRLQRDLPGWDWTNTELLSKRYYRLEDEQAELRRGGGNQRQPKFETYTLPGGTNYREVLMRLPGMEINKQLEEEFERKLIEAGATADQIDYLQKNIATPAADETIKSLGPEAVKAAELYHKKFDRYAKEPYTGPHWSETNVLAHFRLTDRTDKAGKKVLFIEEIQSDWHQKGRELGYRSQKELERIDVEIEKLEKLKNEAGQKLIDRNYMIGHLGGAFATIVDKNREVDGDYPTIASLDESGRISYRQTIDIDEDIKRLVEAYAGPDLRLRELKQQYNTLQRTGVPSAPFKTTWPELAFKRILRMAAEEGYEKVAWTTGEQQADRYPSQMRKVVDNIKWDKGTFGKNVVNVFLSKNGKEVGTLIIDRKTGNVAETVGLPNNIRGSTLSEVVGGKMADQILKQETGEISGEDFVVGDKGMWIFYDQILPSFAKKYTKKFGVKDVGEAEIDAGPRAELKEQGVSAPAEWKEVHAIPVTDEMAESVMGGQVMFETPGERFRRETEQRERINARKARLKEQLARQPKKQAKTRRDRIKINIREVTPGLREDLQEAARAERTKEVLKKGRNLKIPIKEATPELIPGATAAEEVPGGRYVYPEPPPGKGGPPRKVIFDEDFYENNRRRYKDSFRDKVSKAVESVMLGFDRSARAMSTRLEKIAPELKYAVRRYVFDVQTRTVSLVKDAAPMVDAWKKFEKNDKRDFKMAALNGDAEKINELVEKYNVRQQYEDFRAAMDEIFEAGNSVGLEILYDAEHWPRVVKDFKGLIDYLQTTNKWSRIQQALLKRQEQAGGRTLTDAEQAQVINTLLRGFRIGGVSLSRPGAARERTIEVFTSEIENYYYELDEGIQIYIQNMMQSVGAREFFGKETNKIRDLRAQKARLATRLYKTSTRIGYKKPVPEEKHEEHISKAREKFEEVSKKLTEFKTQTVEDSIGYEVLNLYLAGKINYEQQGEIAEMFKAIFEPRGMHGAVRQFTKLAYIDVLANPEVAMTQLEEIGLSFYRSKLKSLPAVARAFSGRSRIKLADIGVDDINQYMQDLGFSELGDKLLFMMQATDMRAKEAYANTAVEEYRAKAKSPDDAFKKKMKQIFGAEAEQVIEELKNGTVSDNVKFLAFSELADMQPIAITETPQYYARGGNHRIWYMLRSFTLRRLDVLLQKTRKAMVNPAKNPVQFITASIDLTQYLAILTAFGVGKDVLRAWFHGRPFDEDDFLDSVIDNLLQFVLLSRWTAMRTKKEGLGSAIGQELMPPTKAIDAVINDVRKGKLEKTIRSIPEIGEPYYWWFGGGTEKSSGRKKKFVR